MRDTRGTGFIARAVQRFLTFVYAKDSLRQRFAAAFAFRIRSNSARTSGIIGTRRIVNSSCRFRHRRARPSRRLRNPSRATQLPLFHLSAYR